MKRDVIGTVDVYELEDDRGVFAVIEVTVNGAELHVEFEEVRTLFVATFAPSAIAVEGAIFVGRYLMRAGRVRSSGIRQRTP